MFSRDTLALMQAAVDAIIVIDHRGRMTALNDATCACSAIGSTSCWAKTCSMLMPEPDRSAHDGYLARYLETGKGQDHRHRPRGHAHSARTARVSRAAFGGPDARIGARRASSGIVRDVSAEHEALAALKLERDRANAYLELNDAILLMLDTERRIREINARGSDILGAPCQDLHGRDWLQFIHGDAERERGRCSCCRARWPAAHRANASSMRATRAASVRRIYWRCIARRAADGSSGRLAVLRRSTSPNGRCARRRARWRRNG